MPRSFEAQSRGGSESRKVTHRDCYCIAEQLALAPHPARPEGRATLEHMCELLCVSLQVTHDLKPEPRALEPILNPKPYT